jgi:acylphosphatase
MPALHLIITGKVQGVFFRASAKKVAEGLRIKGWVKNTREGNVEILCQGENKELEAFIAWCKKGPSNATVENVKSVPAEEQPLEDFKIER